MHILKKKPRGNKLRKYPGHFFQFQQNNLTFKGICSAIKVDTAISQKISKFQFVVINYIGSMGVDGAINYNEYRKFYENVQ